MVFCGGPSVGGTRLSLTGAHMALPTSVREVLDDAMFGGAPMPAFLLGGAESSGTR